MHCCISRVPGICICVAGTEAHQAKATGTREIERSYVSIYRPPMWSTDLTLHTHSLRAMPEAGRDKSPGSRERNHLTDALVSSCDEVTKHIAMGYYRMDGYDMSHRMAIPP